MYALLDQLVGSPALSQAIGQVNQNPALTPPGNFVTAVDPWWGCGEFIYARANGTILPFSLCSLLPVFSTNAFRFDAIAVANTANTGRPLAVALQSMVAGDLGWFCISGVVPISSNAAVAVDTAIGIAAAGQAGANSAGKQILNSRTVQASSTTVAKANCQANVGSTVIQVPNSDGWFPGVFLSGTGIAALTVVTSIDGSGRNVTISVATTAALGTVTATYNNATIFFNVVHLNRPFAQGAIT